MPDFSKFDGSGRIPRPGQHIYLNRHLAPSWDKAQVHVGILPVGSGKSACARSIQQSVGADILTVSNALVAQYAGDYPTVNVLKGKAHYTCSGGMSCKDWAECGFEPCERCPYQAAKGAAHAGFATFFNPMSYYYHLLQGGKGSDTIIIDEAHTLSNMISLLSGKKFKRSEYAFSEKVCNELYFVKWAEDQIRRLSNLSDMYYKRNELEKLSKAKGEIENLALLKQGIEEDPQNYVFWVEKDKRETYLHVKPVFAPRFLMDRLLGNRKVILLSGTLFDHDIKEITGDRSVLKYEMPSPIPVENRLVHWEPAPFKINYQTDPKALAEYIQSHLVKGENTLIHAPYSWSEKLAPFFPKDTITNTADDKEEKIEEFKRRGGVFLASGCAEGVDFKGDFCRLNVIPKLNFPDMKDPIVQKRMAMQDGKTWLNLTTLLTTIQQAGRSTRGADDYSRTLVLDPNFKRVVDSVKKHVPQYFYESIRWR